MTNNAAKVGEERTKFLVSIE